ncbi:MAG: diguanylate phosphodiesterase [Desulfuromonas sp.]|jgi:GAF domain-containing protein|nr:MAG: diguanylate phosphodiesterase [Desulfuromonas sp.]
MSEGEQNKGAQQRAEEFLQVFKKGAEFTQDLLKENERLRYQVLKLEKALPAGETGEVARLKGRIGELESEKLEILSQIKTIEQENQDYDNRYNEIEAENNLLANLYISSYQLHSTLDLTEIIRIIQEILLNLVGVEQFSIMLLDETQKTLRPLVVEGADPQHVSSVQVGEGVIGAVAQSGERRLLGPEESADVFADPIAVIPLVVGTDVIGVLNLYRLLQQKVNFTNIDEELFNLLGTHAATAIFTAMLHMERDSRPIFYDSFFARMAEDLI